VVAPVASEPLWATFFAVTCEPLCEVAAFHAWVIVCPGPKDHVRVHPVIASPRLVTFTSAPKPACHWLVIV
jgi:hypothetical protein